MTPAQKELQPVASQNEIPVTHIDNLDHELVSGVKEQLGDDVKMPPVNELPVPDVVGMAKFNALNNLGNISPNRIGEDGVEKEDVEIKKEPFSPAESVRSFWEQFVHSLKRAKPRINNSGDNLAVAKERAGYMGLKVLRDEVSQVLKKEPELPPEEQEQPVQPTEEVAAQPVLQQQVTEQQPEVVAEQSPVLPPATPQNAPVSLDAYRQTGQIVPDTQELPADQRPQAKAA